MPCPSTRLTCMACTFALNDEETKHRMVRNLIPLLSAEFKLSFTPLETHLRAFPWTVPGTPSLCSASPHHHHPLLQTEAKEKEDPTTWTRWRPA